MLFLSERGARLSRQQVCNLVKRYGELAGLDIEAHPHMLRHGSGFELADQVEGGAHASFDIILGTGTLSTL